MVSIIATLLRRQRVKGFPLRYLVILTILFIEHVRCYNEELLKNFTRYRLNYLREHKNSTILAHIHIPKVGGTALALALTTDCSCHGPYEGGPILHCSKCRKAESHTGMRFDYSITRLTGWKCGVHSPLAAIRNCMGVGHKPKYPLTGNGFSPGYVILMRSPFNRFVSEAFYWYNYTAPDWNAVIDRQNRTVIPGIHPPDQFRENVFHDETVLRDYVSFPSSFIIQNRQTKMIGGKLSDFNLTFNSTTTLGSRWSGRTDHEYMHETFKAARALLIEHPAVIVGIEERFAEFLCLLELLYGDVHSFAWSPKEDSHNPHSTFNAAAASRKYDKWVNTTLFYDWRKQNHQDELLYEVGKYVFDLQFKRALKMFGKIALRNPAHRIPHCRPYV